MNIKKRLDKYLIEYLNVSSRNLSQKLINNNCVLVNKNVINKPNFLVNENDIVEILKEEKYVSRAAYKLLFALEKFNIDISNKIVMDIGSSTGGFTQVCLENNAAKIYCIDVGKNQLSPKVKDNEKVYLYEQTNFKDINALDFNDVNFITCDVSFISIQKILNKIKELNWKNISGIFLLKPQFELTPKEISKGKGKVHPKLLNHVINSFKTFCKNNNFDLINICESPIKGAKKNNIEFLTYLRW